MCTHVKPLLQLRRRSCPSPEGCPVPLGPSPPPPQTAAKPASFALDGFPCLELYGKEIFFFFWVSFLPLSTIISRFFCVAVLVLGLFCFWPTVGIAMVCFFIHLWTDGILLSSWLLLTKLPWTLLASFVRTHTSHSLVDTSMWMAGSCVCRLAFLELLSWPRHHRRLPRPHQHCCSLWVQFF